MATAPRKSANGFCFRTLNESIGCNSVMLCPVCGCAYVHPKRLRSFDCTYVVYSFWCEDGHDFAYRFRFERNQMMIDLSEFYNLSRRRIVRAVMIHLGGREDQSVIVWPNSIPEKPCARLLNSRKSWITAGRDDVVMLTEDQEHWERRYILRIELYRVNPAEHIGEIVESAQAWIEADPTTNKLKRKP